MEIIHFHRRRLEESRRERGDLHGDTPPSAVDFAATSGTSLKGETYMEMLLSIILNEVGDL